MDYNLVQLPFDYNSIIENDIYSRTEYLAFCNHHSIANLFKIKFNNEMNPYYMFLYDINLHLIKKKDHIILRPTYHLQNEGFYKVTYLNVDSSNVFGFIKQLLDNKEMIFVETAANKIRYSKKYNFDDNKMDIKHVFPFVHYDKNYLFVVDQNHMLNYQYFKCYRDSKILGCVYEHELSNAFEYYFKLGCIEFDRKKIEESYLFVYKFLQFCIDSFYRKERNMNDSIILYGEKCLVFLKEGFNKFSDHFTDPYDDFLFDQYSTICHRYYMCRKYLSECLQHYNKLYSKIDITSLINTINEDAGFWQEFLLVCAKSYLTKDNYINDKLGDYFSKAIEKEKYLYSKLEKHIMCSPAIKLQ